MSERTCSIEDRLPERTRVALVPARTAALLLFALALAGCGGSESASHVAELGDYDATKPLRTKIEAENSGSTDITFQSPRGGDVEATIVPPPDAAKGSARPRCTCTVQVLPCALLPRGVRPGDAGVAVLLVNSAMTRQDLAPVDLLDPVYAADAFRSLVRQDLVDLRRALDYLEGRGRHRRPDRRRRPGVRRSVGRRTRSGRRSRRCARIVGRAGRAEPLLGPGVRPTGDLRQLLRAAARLRPGTSAGPVRRRRSDPEPAPRR